MLPKKKLKNPQKARAKVKLRLVNLGRRNQQLLKRKKSLRNLRY